MPSQAYLPPSFDSRFPDWSREQVVIIRLSNDVASGVFLLPGLCEDYTSIIVIYFSAMEGGD